jgi:hypothetical protein
VAHIASYKPRVAVFRPRRRDDLRPHAIPWVGVRHLWAPMWRNEPGENYAGQVSWNPAMPYPRGLEWPGWAPDEDLVFLDEN